MATRRASGGCKGDSAVSHDAPSFFISRLCTVCQGPRRATLSPSRAIELGSKSTMRFLEPLTEFSPRALCCVRRAGGPLRSMRRLSPDDVGGPVRCRHCRQPSVTTAQPSRPSLIELPVVLCRSARTPTGTAAPAECPVDDDELYFHAQVLSFSLSSSPTHLVSLPELGLLAPVVGKADTPN